MRKIFQKFHRRKHHLGYPASAVMFLGIGMMMAQAQNGTGAIPMPARESTNVVIEEENFQNPEDFVDPREIQNTLRDIARMKSEARSLAKRAAKLPKGGELKQQLDEMVSQLDQYAANIKNPPVDYSQREALQEYYDARMWEEMSKIRAQIELPQMLKEIPLAIKRVERLLKLKTYQKIGLDIVGLNNFLAEIKDSYNNAKSAYDQGNFEEAMEELQDINEGGHPGELEGVIRRLKEASDRISIIRDKEIKEQLLETLAPVIEAANDGDFRSANQILNDLFPELMQILQKTYKMKQGSRGEILKKMSTLEEKINTKLEQFEQEKIQKQEKMNQVDEAQPVMEKPKPPQPQPTSINQKQPPMPPIEGGGQVQKPPVGDYQQGPAVNQLPPQQPQQPQPPQPPSQQIP